MEYALSKRNEKGSLKQQVIIQNHNNKTPMCTLSSVSIRVTKFLVAIYNNAINQI